MAAGLPIINTNLPTAVPAIARNGIEALTVPPGDPRALSSAIRTLLEDSGARTLMSRAAQTRAQDEFSQARFLKRTRQVYLDAADARNRSGVHS
jgi:rhamnosyl/mannosyltransferase